MARILFVGGCAAPYHRLEDARPHVVRALNVVGAETEVTGIFHPEGGDAFTGDYSALNADTLKEFEGVVLFTTGGAQGANIAALLDFVRGGGALIGIHCAADSFTDDAHYIAALGGKFRTHPAPLEITLEFTDTMHPITQGLTPFVVRDELYLFSDYDASRVHLLAQTRSYDAEGPEPIPLCWTRNEGEGRVFYLCLGHYPEAMASDGWQSLFQRGVRWALREI